MADPFTITKVTLAGVSFLAKAVDGCIAAYKAYKISAAFGEDWVAAQRRYNIQQTKLVFLSKAPISWFADNLQNEQDEITIAVKLQLAEIESHFIKCRDIIKKYHDIEKKMDEKKVKEVKVVAQELLNQTTQLAQPTKTQDPAKKNVLRKLLLFRKSSSKDEVKKAKEARGSISGASASTSASIMTDSTMVLATDTDEKSIVQTESKYPSEAPARPTHSAPDAEAQAEATPDFITEEIAKAEADAKQRQDALGLYNTVRWVDHDRDNFYKELKEIKNGNRELESLLKLKSDVDPMLVLGEVDEAELDWRMANAKNIQMGARRLQAALARANSPSVERKDGVLFSIQVHEEPDKLADDLLEESKGLPITIGDCWIFAMHCHMSGSVDSASTLLYAKTKKRTYENAQEDVQCETLPSIYDTLAKFETGRHANEYETLGQVKASDTVQDSHILMAHMISNWENPRLLKTVVAQDQYLKANVTSRLQLSRLMIVGFLYMKEVLAMTEKRPRLDTVLLYSSANGERSKDADEDDSNFNPFLSIGFGRKKQGTGRPVGATSGLKKRLINPLAELSLVLFQVATGLVLDYGTGDTGFREAVKQARLNLHKVDTLGGGPLVREVVGLCLDQSTGDNMFKPVDEGDDRIMERLRMWYQKKEEKVR